MFDSPEHLLDKIRLGEDSSLELKSLRFKGHSVSDPTRSDLADEIAAIANTCEAVVVLGVNDKTRDIEGIPTDLLEAAEKYVFEVCSDSIKPPVVFRTFRMQLPDTTGTFRSIIKIEIPRSLFVHKSPNGYFIRQGSSKREMSPDYLARLFQQRSQVRLIRFDEQSVPNAPLDCMEHDLWNRFRTPLSPVDDRDFLLKACLVTRDENGKIYPTVSGILMTCKTPHEYIKSAFIQAVAYRGVERNASYQLDAQEVTGPLDFQISKACDFVNKNMRIFGIKAPNRREIPQYSMNAVFEAVTNAVAHRDYSIYGSKIRLHMFADRIEIFSPGTIPNTMTISSLSERQSSRNELLTSLLARCPLKTQIEDCRRNFIMDKRGEGVPIIITESERLSGIRPIYELIDDTELKLIIFAARPPHGEVND